MVDKIVIRGCIVEIVENTLPHDDRKVVRAHYRGRRLSASFFPEGVEGHSTLEDALAELEYEMEMIDTLKALESGYSMQSALPEYPKSIPLARLRNVRSISGLITGFIYKDVTGLYFVHGETIQTKPYDTELSKMYDTKTGQKYILVDGKPAHISRIVLEPIQNVPKDVE